MILEWLQVFTKTHIRCCQMQERVENEEVIIKVFGYRMSTSAAAGMTFKGNYLNNEGGL